MLIFAKQFIEQQEWKMSTDPRGYTNAIDNTTYIDAIAIAGCVMAGLIALVILRLFVNLCIDVVILGDFHSARRSLSVITRLICPWWHRRTQPEELTSTDSGSGQDVELGGPTRIRRNSIEQTKTAIGSILQSKVRWSWRIIAS